MLRDATLNPNEEIRVLRVLEYTGPRGLVEDHLDRRGLKGSLDGRGYMITIKETFLGDTYTPMPLPLTEEEVKAAHEAL